MSLDTVITSSLAAICALVLGEDTDTTLKTTVHADERILVATGASSVGRVVQPFNLLSLFLDVLKQLSDLIVVKLDIVSSLGLLEERRRRRRRSATLQLR